MWMPLSMPRIAPCSEEAEWMVRSTGLRDRDFGLNALNCMGVKQERQRSQRLIISRAGIYLEDLYVKPEYRHKGYGKGLLKKLAQIAVERGCGRLEWWCLDWNQPSIDFYLSLGAEPMEDWTVYRIAGDTLHKLAE